MTCPFDITAAGNSIRLNAKRHGEASFTVYNRGGSPIRGRAHLVPDNPATAAWFTVAGEVERSFAAAGTEQYVVQVAAPASAPPGSYAFRLDMVDVANPDEVYCEGQTVTFDVPAVAPKPRPRLFGWVAAAIAALVVVGAAAAIFWPRQAAVPELRVQAARAAAHVAAALGGARA